MDAVIYVIPTDAGALAAWATFLSAIAAVASVIVACIALSFSKKQIAMHENHNRLMATPHLSGWNHVDGETETYSFTLENTGIGPAIIKNISLMVDGASTEGKGSDLVENASELLFPDLDKHHQFEMFVVGEFVPPSKRFEIFTIRAPELRAEQIMETVARRAKLLIEYESIYGQKYLFDSDLD